MDSMVSHLLSAYWIFKQLTCRRGGRDIIRCCNRRLPSSLDFRVSFIEFLCSRLNIPCKHSYLIYWTVTLRLLYLLSSVEDPLHLKTVNRLAYDWQFWPGDSHLRYSVILNHILMYSSYPLLLRQNTVVKKAWKTGASMEGVMLAHWSFCISLDIEHDQHDDIMHAPYQSNLKDMNHMLHTNSTWNR